MTKKECALEVFRLLVVMGIAGLVALSAGLWVSSHVPWPVAVWLSRSFLWGLWFIAVSLYISERDELMGLIYSLCGGDYNADRLVYYGSLTIGGIWAGVPAVLCYMSKTDWFATIGAGLFAAVLGVVVMMVAELIAMFCIDAADEIYYIASRSRAFRASPLNTK